MPRSIPLSPSSSSYCAPQLSNLGGRRSQHRDRLHRTPEVERPPLLPNTVGSGGKYSLGKFFLFGKRRNNNPQAALTPESLELHTKRISSAPPKAVAGEGYSPYYGGLLSNNSPALYLAQSLGPGRVQVAESHGPATTISAAFTRSSRASSFIVKLQAVLGSSCFQFRSSKEEDRVRDQNQPPAPPVASAGLRNSARKSTITVVDRSSAVSPRRVEGSDGEKKPLRESFQSGPAAVDDHIGDDIDQDHHAVPPLATNIHEATTARISSSPLNELLKVPGQREFVWADKYQPKALEDFICNRNKAIHLQLLARKGECGHFIFQGPPGVGKRTMIWAMLREAFGPDYIQASEEFKVFNVQGEVVGSIEVLVKESPRLVEVNLSELKGYEKYVIFELIKETSQKISNNALPCKPPDNCRAIIFYGVDKLSTDAILYIKWLLERYKVCNKIFFCCSDVSKLQAIKNLCTVVQLLPPSRTEIVEVLKFIADKEGIELPHQLAEKITDTSKNNLRQAIRSLEATWHKHYPFAEDQEVLTGWEDDIANVAKNMVQEQSPKLLYIIRGKLQNLVEHDVSPELIFQSLVEEVKKHLDHELLKRRVHNLYVEYSRKDESVYESDKALAHTRKSSVQQFLRIEEFIAKFMSCYKAEATKIMQQESEDHKESEEHISET
ncbi:DNA polymerase III [Parasponia andersonii]|uniref:DNA polymerase III n=1 Tax=Parasponia andersonii TaxID=3476 RepID=A0A2P5C6J7_PARAD|nr:DNA polymerase III [Parasponia andersonii]